VPLDLSEKKISFEGKGEHCVYVVNLKPTIKTIVHKKGRAAIFKPPKAMQERPLGFLYVGQTGVDREERLKRHLDGTQSGIGLVAKYGEAWIKRKGITIVTPLWDESQSFSGVNWEDSLKLESWLGWKLSEIGYYVWGPHYHKENNFLGAEPFD
jgi:hypothetical protein